MAAVAPAAGEIRYLPAIGEAEDYDRMLVLLTNKDILPYSLEDEKVFEASSKATEWAKTCMSWRGYSVGLLIPSALAVISLNVGGFLDETNSKTGMIVAALLVVVVSNWWSMYATGDVTATASDLQNKDQNAVEELGRRFTKLGKHMLMGYECSPDRERIYECAKRIDIKRIRDAIKKVSTQELKVDSAVEYLANVTSYIATGRTADPEILFDTKLLRSLREGATAPTDDAAV